MIFEYNLGNPPNTFSTEYLWSSAFMTLNLAEQIYLAKKARSLNFCRVNFSETEFRGNEHCGTSSMVHIKCNSNQTSQTKLFKF